VQFETIEEQREKAMALLFRQDPRFCVARLNRMKEPVSLYTEDVDKPFVTAALSDHSGAAAQGRQTPLPSPTPRELFGQAQNKQFNLEPRAGRAGCQSGHFSCGVLKFLQRPVEFGLLRGFARSECT